MRRIDETNLLILRYLQDDARMSIAELSRRVLRSEATVRERVDFLEKSGVIQNYRAGLDLEKVGIGAGAIVRASIDKREVPRLAKDIAAIPNVVNAEVVSGERPVRIRLAARNMSELEDVLREKIAKLGLSDIDVRIILQEIVPNRAIDLDALRADGDGMLAKVVPLVKTKAKP